MKLNAISSKSPANHGFNCPSKVLMYPKLKTKRVRYTQPNNLHNQLYYDVPPMRFGLYKAIIRKVVYKGMRTQQILSKMYIRVAFKYINVIN